MSKKTAIITGGSTGIGFETAKQFLKADYNVVLNARTQADLAKAEAELAPLGNVVTVSGDVANKETGAALAAKAEEQFGGVDVLVNNAGVFYAKPFLDTEEAELDRFFAINFKGSYFAAQAIVPQMKKRGGGAIINVGTTLLDHAIGGFPATGALASKAALTSLTNTLASEFGPDNIRVSTIGTGVIDTPLHGKHGIEDVAAFAGLHLVNRVGTSRHMADAILMLAQNDFITGTVLRVDGGHSAGHVMA